MVSARIQQISRSLTAVDDSVVMQVMDGDCGMERGRSNDEHQDG